MDNLIELAKSDSLIMLIIAVPVVLGVITKYITAHRNGEKKNKRKALLLFLLCFGYILVYLYLAKSAYLDYKTMDIQKANGIVQRERWIRRKFVNDKYEYTFLTEEGVEIEVYIARGKREEYSLQEGNKYVVEYFPRTKAVYRVTPID